MTARTLYLFPGAHKTATTLLQRALEIHRDALEAKGFAIARRQVYYRIGLHKFLTSGPVDPGVTSDPDWVDATLYEAFGHDPRERDVILSIENLFGEVGPRLYPNADLVLDNLGRLFPNHRIVATYYIRRQDTFLESAFAQSVHRGSSSAFETFFTPFRNCILDWGRVIDPMIRRLGRDEVRVVPFETLKNGSDDYITDFFARFCDLRSEEVLAKTETKLGDTNRTLSALGIEVARAAFDALPELRERRKLVKLLQREFGSDKYPPFCIPEKIRHEIAQTHKAVNAALVEQGLLTQNFADYYMFRTNELSSP